MNKITIIAVVLAIWTQLDFHFAVTTSRHNAAARRELRAETRLRFCLSLVCRNCLYLSAHSFDFSPIIQEERSSTSALTEPSLIELY